jgi:biotin transport system substrate-specific component
MKSTKKMIIVGMFAAVIAVLAQIAFPLPSGVPVTLQTFAVVLTGVVLGARLGTAATFVYILLGAVGVPVFSGLGGGLGVIVGKTGGFIWGFLFLSLFSGLALLPKRRRFGVFIPMIGLTLCHLMGSVQYSVLSGMNVWQARVRALSGEGHLFRCAGISDRYQNSRTALSRLVFVPGWETGGRGTKDAVIVRY